MTKPRGKKGRRRSDSPTSSESSFDDLPTLFLGVSAMMLPGIEGFAASSYVLSNALVLAIAYGWIGLAGYALASFLLLVREAVPRAADAMAAPSASESLEG